MPTNLERRFQQEVNLRNLRNSKPIKLNLEVILLVLFLVGMGFVYSSWVRQGNANISTKSSTSKTSVATNSTAKTVNPIEKPKPIELPPSGILQPAAPLDGENLARIRIFLRAPLSSDESSLPATCSDDRNLGIVENKTHRFVQLLNWESNEVITTAFVRSGEMVEIPIPLGSYKLRYAIGSQWYGEEKMFGSPDMYEMTDRFSTETAKFEFTEFQPGSDIGAYCSNGNLGKKLVRTDSSGSSNPL
jgi:hypothetical protein